MGNSPSEAGASSDEFERVKLFIAIQLFFLLLSTLAGGFHFKAWSMLDTALLIQSIGVTGLVAILEEPPLRRFAFRSAVVIYLLAVFDMSLNVLLSGVVGWRGV